MHISKTWKKRHLSYQVGQFNNSYSKEEERNVSATAYFYAAGNDPLEKI